MAGTLYDHGFYSQHAAESLESARIVAPLVMRAASINSVIDIGCGVGAWLRAFRENGVASVRGVDGKYVDPSKLCIPQECFTAMDLTEPDVLEGRYDLALCLEVAEHLGTLSGRTLVRVLSDLAPLILFSAAIPGQGGIGHVNEQWPEYWRRSFEERGFKMLDLVRPQVREDRRVKWWYRQNIVMFASEVAISANPSLRETVADYSRLRLDDDKGIEWIHINMLCPPHAGVRNLLVHLRPLLHNAIRKRFRKNA
ncbi:MAG TPA: methyltransferase domain-containing protein [Candidatus Binataceae bacterium]|nr:methyltransferase domain-containing protein [Candidatus Binataceae bacterium]